MKGLGWKRWNFTLLRVTWWPFKLLLGIAVFFWVVFFFLRYSLTFTKVLQPIKLNTKNWHNGSQFLSLPYLFLLVITEKAITASTCSAKTYIDWLPPRQHLQLAQQIDMFVYVNVPQRARDREYANCLRKNTHAELCRHTKRFVYVPKFW